MATIYKIQNITNGMFYLGSTTNWDRRRYIHQWELKNNRHHCNHLQSAWNKYGEDSFEFIIVEHWPENTLLDREQYFLDLYYNVTYNTNPIAVNPPSWKDKAHSEDTKVKMSLSAKGRKASLKTRQKLSHIAKSRTGDKNGMFGKTLSDEHKKAVSKGARKRMGLNNGRAKPISILLVNHDGRTYEGVNVYVNDIARELGVDRRGLGAVIRGTKKTYKGWKIKCPS